MGNAAFCWEEFTKTRLCRNGLWGRTASKYSSGRQEHQLQNLLQVEVNINKRFMSHIYVPLKHQQNGS